jgi:hypothetical protein
MLNTDDLKLLRTIVINDLKNNIGRDLPDDIYIFDIERILELQKKLQNMIKEMEGKQNGNN